MSIIIGVFIYLILKVFIIDRRTIKRLRHRIELQERQLKVKDRVLQSLYQSNAKLSNQL